MSLLKNAWCLRHQYLNLDFTWNNTLPVYIDRNTHLSRGRPLHSNSDRRPTAGIPAAKTSCTVDYGRESFR